MATILINISSDSRKTNESTDNFSVDFSPSVPINGNWELALESLSIWYSWYNVSSDYGNNTIRYNNGSVWRTVTFPSGLYSIDDLNTLLEEAMVANSDFSTGAGGNVYYINIAPNYNTFKTRITVSNSYQVDLTVGNLYSLLGFDSIIVTTTQEGVNNVNITNGIDRVCVHLDCITGSWSGTKSSDILYSFNADGAPSSLLQIKPYRLVYLPMTKSGFLNSIKIYITNQNGGRLNLNGETVTAQLILRRKS